MQVALAHAATVLPIPLDAFDELVDGCEMDVTHRSYRDLTELIDYCRCVAGSIGRLSLGVFDPPLRGDDDAEAKRLANTLGVALQLTNILRDIREDLAAGRVYLPTQDLELFGVELRTADDGSLDPQDGRLAELIRFEAARAAGRYDEGLRLLPMLDWRSAACAGAMAGIYRELLSPHRRRPHHRHARTSRSADAGQAPGGDQGDGAERLRMSTSAIVVGGGLAGSQRHCGWPMRAQRFSSLKGARD